MTRKATPLHTVSALITLHLSNIQGKAVLFGSLFSTQWTNGVIPKRAVLWPSGGGGRDGRGAHVGPYLYRSPAACTLGMFGMLVYRRKLRFVYTDILATHRKFFHSFLLSQLIQSWVQFMDTLCGTRAESSKDWAD
jgi:hypothetical protein